MNSFFEPLEMPRIDFDSPVVSVLLRLERLRGSFARVTAPLPWLRQLGLLPGNGAASSDAAVLPDCEIDEGLVRNIRCELPGDYGREYRRMEYIPGLMWDLFQFLKREFPPQYDFLKVAVVYRRFLKISPFVTENRAVAGRLAEIMTARAIPGAFFDSAKVFGEFDEEQLNVVDFCEGVLRSLETELSKTFRLLDAGFVKREIVEPAVQALERRRLATRDELRSIAVAVEKPEFSAQDLSGIWADQFLRSRNIRKMLEAGFIIPVKDGGRKYSLNLSRFAEMSGFQISSVG